jgi:hypothetical protein
MDALPLDVQDLVAAYCLPKPLAGFFSPWFCIHKALLEQCFQESAWKEEEHAIRNLCRDCRYVCSIDAFHGLPHWESRVLFYGRYVYDVETLHSSLRAGKKPAWI